MYPNRLGNDELVDLLVRTRDRATELSETLQVLTNELTRRLYDEGDQSVQPRPE